MIIRALTVVSVIILGITLIFHPAVAQSVRDRLAKDAVVAVVNDKQIISSELIQAFQSLPRQHRQRGSFTECHFLPHLRCGRGPRRRTRSARLRSVKLETS